MDPIRTCTICRQKMNKSQLTRIVKNDIGDVIIDKKQKCNSRGLYVCKNQKCIESLQKHKKVIAAMGKENIVSIIKELGGIEF